MIDAKHAWDWTDRLAAVGQAVRSAVVAARTSGQDMTQAVAQEGGDTIFALDRHVEPVIEEQIASWPASCLPLEVIAEGWGEQGIRRFGDAAEEPQFRVILDPIDGTRNIMYDKRSAWFIGAVTAGSARLGDAFAAVLVELPTSKAASGDAFAAVRGRGVRTSRLSLAGQSLPGPVVAPSRATTLLHGFAQVSNFFPGTKVLAAQLMEQIVRQTLGPSDPGVATVFDDQYVSTAGQMVELMLGHDRFCCDLRPLFHHIIARQTGMPHPGLECHPYDCAGALVAQEAGVIITDGFGQPLDAPLDVQTGVHWCGYANATLRSAIEPVIQGFWREHGMLFF